MIHGQSINFVLCNDACSLQCTDTGVWVTGMVSAS